MSKKYQVYKDIKGKYRFRLLAENNKIVAVGQGYEQHESCINGIRSIQSNCNAEVEDLTIEEAKIPDPKYQIFYDKSCGYRFHLKAKNGEIIVQSEGYESKQGCLNGVHAVKTSCDAEIEDLTRTQKPKEETISYHEIPEANVEAKIPEVVPEPIKVPEVQPIVSEPVVGPKVEIPQSVVVAPVEIQAPTSTGPAQTVLELQNLTTANKGDIVSFQGKLFRSDSGKGIPDAKIDIYEHDRSLLGDDYLAYGKTAEDGSFSVIWTARSLAWFDNTGKIYARFKGNEQANPSKSAIQTITIN